MTLKPVIPTRMAKQDVEDELEYYLADAGSQKAALDFITALEQAYAHLSKHPTSGSPRYAYELDIPGLRCWPLDRYPHLIFYVERKQHVEIWRVLSGKRDIPSWLLGDDEKNR